MKRLFCLALALAVACTARPRHASRSDEDDDEPGTRDRRLVEIDLSRGMPEGSGSGLFQLPATRTYTGLVRALERAYDDPLTAGLFVLLGTQHVDFARAEELSGLIGRIRDKGTPVVCHTHDLANASAWLLARGCSRIWLSAAGSVDTVGIAAEIVHLRGLLDKLKIDVDFLAIGKYKSGAEPLTREEPSEAAKESLSSTLGSFRQTWLDGADQGRPKAHLRDVLERGPYSPVEAKEASIVDALGYESDALAEAKRLAKTHLSTVGFGPSGKQGSGFDIGELVRVLSGADESSAGRPRIAVVPAEGAIGMEAGGPLDSGGISAKALTRTLRRLKDDDNVKAVVLRIDSPGGSPLASDLIWHELMLLRKEKPTVASVGSLAASGGYYIACGAERIVAERTSIVGSIGVFGGKIVIGPALHELGINAFPVPANPDPDAARRASYLSPFTRWDEATRERVRTHMQSIYDLFVARVAEARKLSVDVVRPNAEGRIWSGAQGKERNLVDEIGGLSRALDLVRAMAGLGRDTPVSVEGPREGLLELLMLGDDASESEVRAALVEFERAHAPLAALPQELRTHAAVLSPLLRGESVIAALPLALVVH